jgi:hypothetical protein
MRLLVALVAWFLRAVFASHGSLALENLALRQQLATCARGQKHPQLKPEERVFWVALSRVWPEWRSPLALVKPAAVIAWHRRGFQRFWRWRSRTPGRPRIPVEHSCPGYRLRPPASRGCAIVMVEAAEYG